MSNASEESSNHATLVEDIVNSVLKKMRSTIEEATSTAANKVSEELKKTHAQELDRIERKQDRKRKYDQTNFVGKGNQAQYTSNINIMEKIDEAIDRLESEDIDNAKKKLEEGKILIHNRNKLIKIADREDWLTATEFNGDNLLSGSEEERQLKRAIKSASVKRERAKMHRSGFERNYTRTRENYHRSYNGMKRGEEREFTTNREVVCYSCNRTGHYSSACPFTRKSLRSPVHDKISNEHKY